MNHLRKLWAATKEAVARMFHRQMQPAIVIVRVIYMWRPSLTIRRVRIDAAVAAEHGQLPLF